MIRFNHFKQGMIAFFLKQQIIFRSRPLGLAHAIPPQAGLPALL
jgi:hypothetical protein